MGTLLSSSKAAYSSTQAKPFRFLDLPAELRYMVYEEIETSTCHYRLKDPSFKPKSEDQITPASYMTLVVKSLPVALLATCRLIHEEAAPFLAPKLEKLRDEPSHFIIDSTSFHSFVNPYRSIGTILKKHEYDEIEKNWYSAGAGKDPENWIPRWFDIAWRSCNPRYHVFIHGSEEHAAIVAFYRKCLAVRTHRYTTKTVITVRYRFGSHDDFPSDMDLTTWLTDRARDGFELQLSGFSDEQIRIAIFDFEMVKSFDRIDQHWQIREISDAEWNTVSRRDGVVDVDGERIPQPGMLGELICLAITKMGALVGLK